MKLNDDNISKSLYYYTKRLKPRRATQIVANLRAPCDNKGIRVTDPISYFKGGSAFYS